MAEIDQRLEVIVHQIAHDWGALGLTRLIFLASKRLREMLETGRVKDVKHKARTD